MKFWNFFKKNKVCKRESDKEMEKRFELIFMLVQSGHRSIIYCEDEKEALSDFLLKRGYKFLEKEGNLS